LVNSTIILNEQDEEIALPLKGKEKHLTRNVLVNYFGIERCELTEKSIEKVLETISLAIPKWKTLIEISFFIKRNERQIPRFIGWTLNYPENLIS